MGIILIVHEKTGSLALAGGVLAALWIAAGVSRPILSCGKSSGVTWNRSLRYTGS